MRLVEFKYDDGTTGWLNPANVAEVAPRKVDGKPTGRSAVYYAGCVDENHCTWAADDPASLAARIEAALRDDEYVVEESGKDGASPDVAPVSGMWRTPVPMSTIPSKEYRELLEETELLRRSLSAYVAEEEKLKDALAEARRELMVAHNEKAGLLRELAAKGGEE